MSNLDGLPTLVTLKGPNDVAVPNNLVCVDETKHIAGLDGLRAIAIVAVLVAHGFQFSQSSSAGRPEMLVESEETLPNQARRLCTSMSTNQTSFAMPTKVAYIAGLDGLRAIAICLVLIAFEFEFGAEFSTGQVERLFSKVAGHLGSFYDS